MKVFLIDDDQDDREIFRDALNECDPDITFLCANNGPEALSTIDSMNDMPDVIFADNYMPVMSGIECLQALRLNVRTRLIPTVIYSTSGDPEQKKIMLLSRADYFLQSIPRFPIWSRNSARCSA